MANKDKLLESAQKYLAKGQLPKAIGEYQKLIEAFPKDFRNRQKLAELLGREKRNAEAQPHYEAVARNFAETGFYLKAIAIYKQMQKFEPSRADIYLRLAELNEKQGLIGNALGEYRSLIALYDKNRMLRESVGVLKKLIALEPENLGTRGKLIEVLVDIDEQGEALEHFQALVRLLAGKGEPAKVVKLYEKCHDLCPDEVESRLPLAEALLKSGQAEKSLPLLKSLLKQAPEHPVLLSLLIDCHLELGNHDDARLTCQHLLKELPQDLDLRERYIRICLAGSEFERALENLEDGKAAFSRAGRIVVLRELYEKLQPFLPVDARLQETLAAIYETTAEAGDHPSLNAPREGTSIEDETADAALVDAALDDVEPLALDGEAIAPEGIPAAPVAPISAAAPPGAPRGDAEVEMELELDLGGFDELAAELASSEMQPATAVPTEASLPADAREELEFELDLGELDELVFATSSDESALKSGEPRRPEVDGLEFGIEPSAAAMTVDAPDPFSLGPGVAVEAAALFASPAAELPPPAVDESAFEPRPGRAACEEPEELEDLETIEELEEVEGPEPAHAGVYCEDLAGLEDLAELDADEAVEVLEEAEVDEVCELGVDSPATHRLRDELEEAEFFLRQSLFDDAERVVLAALGRYGELPELTGRLAEIAAQRQAAAEIGGVDETSAFAEFMADLKEGELLGAADSLDDTAEAPADEFPLESPDEESEDAQSHFDLGIAYKEMGLFDDAIGEFSKAARDPARHLDCLMLEGQCQIAMGNVAAAEQTYRQALQLPALSEAGRTVLLYELGLLYEALKRPVEALENYQMVADRDLFYRDVTDKLKQLRIRLGLDDQTIENLSEKDSRRDRISYV